MLTMTQHIETDTSHHGNIGHSSLHLMHLTQPKIVHKTGTTKGTWHICLTAKDQ